MRDVTAGLGTIKGMSPLQESEEKHTAMAAEAKDSPFEEPLVDLFT